MDRNVYATLPMQHADGAEPPPEQPKPWEKLLAYFPAEATALYATLAPLLDTALDGQALTTALWIALALSAVFGVMFQIKFWQVVRKDQLVTSVLAFVVYSAALGGPFERMSWYQPVWAVIASVVVSAFIIFLPAPTDPR